MKDFINYNQALELKQLEFDEPCFGRYDGKGNNKGKLWYEMPNSGQDTIPVGDVLAPTFSQAFRFFREKYDITQTVARDGSLAKEGKWAYTIVSDYIFFNDGHLSHEEAESACLDKLIQIAKSK